MSTRRFRVSSESRSVYDVHWASGGLELIERSVVTVFCKDYDQFEDPRSWSGNFDTRHWVLISAFAGSQRVAGVIVATATPDVDFLENRPELAVLWDLRVAPAYRRKFVATALVNASETWARGRGCTGLKVETQNTNPAACKFYMASGFFLAEAMRDAYPGLPGDVKLIWRKKLDG